MSADNPLTHPDILPLVLSFAPDRTLAALMRTSRTHLSAVIAFLYPCICLDPGVIATSRPNALRKDLPADAKWFSGAFTAYIARYAKVVSVKGHGGWMCPPKGIMLGFGGETGAEGTLSGNGMAGERIGGAAESREGDGGLGVDINCLRLDIAGVCRPQSNQCPILTFFRPDTTFIPAFISSGQLQIASSIYMPKSTRRLIVELDLWKYGSYTAGILPRGVDLAERLSPNLKEIEILILPTALGMKRSAQPIYGVFVGALAGFISVAAAGARGDDGREESGTCCAGSVEDGMNVEESRRDDPARGVDRTLLPTTTIAITGLGQLNPSWALKKTWNEAQLEHLILFDIYAHLGTLKIDDGSISCPQLSDHSVSDLDAIRLYLRTTPLLTYLQSRPAKSQTPPELHADRIQRAMGQGQAIRAAARKVAVREKEVEAKRRRLVPGEEDGPGGMDTVDLHGVVAQGSASGLNGGLGLDMTMGEGPGDGIQGVQQGGILADGQQQTGGW